MNDGGWNLGSRREEARSLPLEAKALSNLILDWAASDGISVTPMKLQKLLFFCHADYLTSYGEPLLQQEFEAWDYGPVIPSLYAEFKDFGSREINRRAMSFDPIRAKRVHLACDLDQDTYERVKALYSFYSRFSAERLSDMSHSPGGAWRHARSMFANGLNVGRRIGDDIIRKFHRMRHF